MLSVAVRIAGGAVFHVSGNEVLDFSGSIYGFVSVVYVKKTYGRLVRPARSSNPKIT